MANKLRSRYAHAETCLGQRYKLAQKTMSRLIILMPSVNFASSSELPIELAAEQS